MEPSSLRAFLCILCEVPSEENLLAVDVTVFKAGGKFSRSDTSRNATIEKDKKINAPLSDPAKTQNLYFTCLTSFWTNSSCPMVSEKNLYMKPVSFGNSKYENENYFSSKMASRASASTLQYIGIALQYPNSYSCLQPSFLPVYFCFKFRFHIFTFKAP